MAAWSIYEPVEKAFLQLDVALDAVYLAERSLAYARGALAGRAFRYAEVAQEAAQTALELGREATRVMFEASRIFRMISGSGKLVEFVASTETGWDTFRISRVWVDDDLALTDADDGGWDALEQVYGVTEDELVEFVDATVEEEGL